MKRQQDPMRHLIAAYNGFRAEARRSSDHAYAKAALEDAAAVADAINSIENGDHRGQYTEVHLKNIARTKW